MKKLKYYFRVVTGASFKRFFNVVNEAHKRSGKSKIYCFFDIIYCIFRYKAAYHDYIIFEFWKYNDAQRKTFLTRFKSKKFIMYMNDPEYSHIFDNKNEFNKVFKDFIGRDFIDLEDTTKEEVEKFFKSHKEIFCKPKDLSCGHGCEKVYSKDYKDFEEFWKYINKKKFGTIEEVVKNHPEINKLYPFAANTLRVITMLDEKGKPHCIYAVFKMGKDGRIVDNYGLHGPIDLKTGEFMYPAHSGDTTEDKLYTEHPYSHIPLIGYKVPMYKETIECAKKATLVVPQMRYVGWDIAITPKGPAIIEGNNYCAHDFWQLPGQTPDGIGIIPTIEKYIKDYKF